ncbi:unnamed protein product [Gulo gulo]|uniref:Uncharacterized protein n=1 Tax=Gulo gulo TaxID=48420 RepID=A0A9X9LHX9_GULGU|nr:unnamed protein product [Gulo gulo]
MLLSLVPAKAWLPVTWAVSGTPDISSKDENLPLPRLISLRRPGRI